MSGRHGDIAPEARAQIDALRKAGKPRLARVVEAAHGLPVEGDSFNVGPLLVRVGYHNGDFRHVSIYFKDHPIAVRQSVPAWVLKELKERAGDNAGETNKEDL